MKKINIIAVIGLLIMATGCSLNGEPSKETVAQQPRAVATPESQAQEIQIVPNEDMASEFQVMVKNGEVFKTISREGLSVVSYEKDTADYFYFGFNFDGLGGAIAYGGPDEAWRVDKKTLEAEQIFAPGIGIFNDVSPGETMIVYINQMNAVEGQELIVENLTTGVKTVHVASLDLPFLGSAKFSPNGSQVAFSATNEDQSRSKIFIASVDEDGNKIEYESSEDSVLYIEEWNGEEELKTTTTAILPQ